MTTTRPPMPTTETGAMSELPEAIEQALYDYRLATQAWERDGVKAFPDYATADVALRAAILAALEPERALRERAERLRQFAIDPMAAMNLRASDLADNLTATSSVHEGREME